MTIEFSSIPDLIGWLVIVGFGGLVVIYVVAIIWWWLISR